MEDIKKLEAERLSLEVEQQKLQNEAIRLNNAKLVREADEVKRQEDYKADNLRKKGVALLSQRPENKHKEIRKTCNHFMGGKGRASFIAGRGDTREDACVVKTKLPTGDVIIRCQRCRSTWVPPWEAMFYKDKNGHSLPVYDKTGHLIDFKAIGAKFDAVAFEKAQQEYTEAYNLPSNLAMVITPQYRWSRGGRPINREVTYRFLNLIVK